MFTQVSVSNESFERCDFRVFRIKEINIHLEIVTLRSWSCLLSSSIRRIVNAWPHDSTILYVWAQRQSFLRIRLFAQIPRKPINLIELEVFCGYIIRSYIMIGEHSSIQINRWIIIAYEVDFWNYDKSFGYDCQISSRILSVLSKSTSNPTSVKFFWILHGNFSNHCRFPNECLTDNPKNEVMIPKTKQVLVY